MPCAKSTGHNKELEPERSEKASFRRETSLGRGGKVNQVCVLVGEIPGRGNSMCQDPEMGGRMDISKNWEQASELGQGAQDKA